MKKNKQIVSANLTELAAIIYRRLSIIKGKGWFSNWLSEKLIETYYLKFEKTILVESLAKLQSKRDKLEIEMEKMAKRIKKVKK